MVEGNGVVWAQGGAKRRPYLQQLDGGLCPQDGEEGGYGKEGRGSQGETKEGTEGKGMVKRKRDPHLQLINDGLYS